jgi:hypothetical protein
MNVQALIDGMGMQMQKERAETQLTLGKLIKALEAMPADAEVANLFNLHSFRGYYEDLAFEQDEGLRKVSGLLAECKNAMGQVFEGYKGGDYVMGELTPLWISEYGFSSDIRLMAVHAGGQIETKNQNLYAKHSSP